jgi:hypothetical protein
MEGAWLQKKRGENYDNDNEKIMKIGGDKSHEKEFASVSIGYFDGVWTGGVGASGGEFV